MLIHAYRVDEHPEVDIFAGTKLFLEEYKDVIQKAYIVKEVAKKTGKIHLQGVLYIDDSVKLKDMRNFIVRKVLRGKNTSGCYAFPPVKELSKYMVYLQKGEQGWIDGLKGFIEGEAPQVWYSYNMDLAMLEEYREVALGEQEKYLRVSKGKKKTIGQEIIDYCKEREDLFLSVKDTSTVVDNMTGNVKVTYRLDQRVLLKVVAASFTSAAKRFNPNIVEDYFNLVLSIYDTEVAYDYIAERVSEKRYLGPLFFSKDSI